MYWYGINETKLRQRTAFISTIRLNSSNYPQGFTPLTCNVTSNVGSIVDGENNEIENCVTTPQRKTFNFNGNVNVKYPIIQVNVTGTNSDGDSESLIHQTILTNHVFAKIIIPSNVPIGFPYQINLSTNNFNGAITGATWFYGNKELRSRVIGGNKVIYDGDLTGETSGKNAEFKFNFHRNVDEISREYVINVRSRLDPPAGLSIISLSDLTFEVCNNTRMDDATLRVNFVSINDPLVPLSPNVNLSGTWNIKHQNELIRGAGGRFNVDTNVLNVCPGQSINNLPQFNILFDYQINLDRGNEYNFLSHNSRNLLTRHYEYDNSTLNKLNTYEIRTLDVVQRRLPNVMVEVRRFNEHDAEEYLVGNPITNAEGDTSFRFENGKRYSITFRDVVTKQIYKKLIRERLACSDGIRTCQRQLNLNPLQLERTRYLIDGYSFSPPQRSLTETANVVFSDFDTYEKGERNVSIKATQLPDNVTGIGGVNVIRRKRVNVLCQSSVISSSGRISCTFPSTSLKSESNPILVTITMRNKDNLNSDVEIVFNQYRIDVEPSTAPNLDYLVLWVFFSIALVLLSLSNPILAILSIPTSIIIGIGLDMINGRLDFWAGYFSYFIAIVIACVIMITKRRTGGQE